MRSALNNNDSSNAMVDYLLHNLTYVCLHLALGKCLLKARDKYFLIFCQPRLDFSPNGWAILVLHANDVVNDSVNLMLIVSCHFYACLFENLVKMPEVTGHIYSLRHADTCIRVIS